MQGHGRLGGVHHVLFQERQTVLLQGRQTGQEPDPAIKVQPLGQEQDSANKKGKKIVRVANKSWIFHTKTPSKIIKISGFFYYGSVSR